MIVGYMQQQQCTGYRTYVFVWQIIVTWCYSCIGSARHKNKCIYCIVILLNLMQWKYRVYKLKCTCTLCSMQSEYIQCNNILGCHQHTHTYTHTPNHTALTFSPTFIRPFEWVAYAQYEQCEMHNSHEILPLFYG